MTSLILWGGEKGEKGSTDKFLCFSRKGGAERALIQGPPGAKTAASGRAWVGGRAWLCWGGKEDVVGGRGWGAGDLFGSQARLAWPLLKEPAI